MADTPVTTKKIDWIKVWTFVKGRIFEVLIIAALVAFSVMQCSRINEMKTQKKIDDQNIAARNDTVSKYKTKLGYLSYSIDSYVSSAKELKTLNDFLYQQLKDQKGYVIAITNTNIKLKQDSAELAKLLDKKDKIINSMTKVNDSTYYANWTLPYKYDSLNYDNFEGRTVIGVKSNPFSLLNKDTYLIKRTSQINITFGEEVVDKKLRVFINSKYPGFSVTSMKGFMLDPNEDKYIQSLLKKKHWFAGFGVGPSINAGWNILEMKPALNIGLSFHYTIYEW